MKSAPPKTYLPPLVVLAVERVCAALRAGEVDEREAADLLVHCEQ